ncbi:MAG: ZIP family metal transporter [Patescibacteria group bacterium]
MDTLLTVVPAFIAVGIVSIVSLIGVVALSWKESLLRSVLFLLISVAAGALLGDAFIHLIPEAFEETGDPLLISLLILGGFLAFFILEKLLNWHHVHTDEPLLAEEHARIHPVGHLVLISDGLHNLVDGVAIGAAFMVSIEVGVATTIAIILHEIPQEIGDFALLIHAGFSRTKALFFNFLSAISAFVGVGLAVWIGSVFETTTPLIAAFAAGMFVYIAGSDLIPELHKTSGIKKSLIQLGAILVGIAVMVALLVLE